MVTVAADGCTPIFSISGVYDYEFLDSTTVKMYSPVPPWLNLPQKYVPPYPTDNTVIFRDESNTSTLSSR